MEVFRRGPFVWTEVNKVVTEGGRGRGWGRDRGRDRGRGVGGLYGLMNRELHK